MELLFRTTYVFRDFELTRPMSTARDDKSFVTTAGDSLLADEGPVQTTRRLHGLFSFVYSLRVIKKKYNGNTKIFRSFDTIFLLCCDVLYLIYILLRMLCTHYILNKSMMVTYLAPI